jgi:RNA polymerase sigma factor (sigma-70 family)
MISDNLRTADIEDCHMSKTQLDSQPTRETLLHRLKNPDDRASWEEFYALYYRRVYYFALRRGMSSHEAEDVVQETFIRVTKQMPGFQYDSSRGKFRSWLLHMAQWRVSDEFRRRGRCPSVSLASEVASHESALEQIPDSSVDQDLEARINQEWQEAVLDAALQKVKSLVSAKQFQAYDLYVIQRWPAAKVAAALGITAAGVHLNKHRVSKLLKSEVEGLNKDRI